MASPGDIAEVRLNVDEPDDTNGYDDTVIGTYVDASDVTGASAKIWEQKAAKFSELVNVSEAGASHAFSDIYKNAAAMAAYWTKKGVDAATAAGTVGRPRIKSIERT